MAKTEELTSDQKRLWATDIAEFALKTWRDAGRTCLLMAALPDDGGCTIAAYETEAEALGHKEKTDIQLGKGHSIIRPLPPIADASEQRCDWEIKSPDSLENKILSAVLFDKHREPKLVLLNTSDGVAYDKGIEIKAAIVVFVGANPPPQNKKSDFWIAGMRFAEGYGMPSERILEQLGQRAIKEVFDTVLVKASGMAAGKA